LALEGLHDVAVAAEHAKRDHDLGLDDRLSMLFVDAAAPDENRLLLLYLVVELDNKEMSPAVRP